MHLMMNYHFYGFLGVFIRFRVRFHRYHNRFTRLCGVHFFPIGKTHSLAVGQSQIKSENRKIQAKTLLNYIFNIDLNPKTSTQIFFIHLSSWNEIKANVGC